MVIDPLKQQATFDAQSATEKQKLAVYQYNQVQVERQRKLFEAGFAGLSWPAEFGGAGADAKIKAIFNEEMDRSGAPERLNIIGEDFAGPTIVAFGSDDQKQRYLAPILEGEEIWCQLFSEPESGSDLASLRTKATKVAGGWKIQGQKIWTSRAQIADNAI